LGIGPARNRLQKAVKRTVPFQFIVYSLIIVWYSTYGHHPDDIAQRRAAQPRYPSKHEPAFEAMLTKPTAVVYDDIRRTIRPITAYESTDGEIARWRFQEVQDERSRQFKRQPVRA
jgi:hypothetical protein